MSKLSDIAKVLADKYKLTNKEAVEFLDEFNNLISSALKTDRIVKIKGLGTFRVMKVSSRESVDVNTGERIIIEGRNKISFTPDATMRDLVNSPFAQFSTVILNDGVDFSDIDKKYDNKMADADCVTEGSKVTGESAGKPVVETAGEAYGEVIDDSCDDAVVSSSDDENTEDATKKVMNNIFTTIIEEHENTDKKSVQNVACNHIPDEPSEGDVDEDDVAVVEIVPDDESVDAIGDGYAQSVEEDVDNDDVEKASTTDDKENKPLEFVHENSSDDNSSGMDIASVNEDEKETSEETNDRSDEEINITELLGQDRSDDNSDCIDENETELRHDKQMKIVIALFSVFVLLCIAGVFYFYNQLQIRDHRIQHLEAQINGLIPECKDSSAVDSQNVTTALTPDSITNIQTKEMKKAENEQKDQQCASGPEPKVVKEPLVAPVKAIAVKEPSPTPPSSEYKKDARVRTGAYEITGVDQTVTVKSGQTLKSISRFYLGEGMECYVEVLNGVKDVKKGDIIKIPKLKLKKRK